jgi:hypothetical protein
MPVTTVHYTGASAPFRPQKFRGCARQAGATNRLGGNLLFELEQARILELAVNASGSRTTATANQEQRVNHKRGLCRKT